MISLIDVIEAQLWRGCDGKAGRRFATLVPLPHCGEGRLEIAGEFAGVEKGTGQAICRELGANGGKCGRVAREVQGEGFVLCCEPAISSGRRPL
jgi:hypothetical protein